MSTTGQQDGDNLVKVSTASPILEGKLVMSFKNPATRAEVYAAIDGERDYQEMRVVRDGSTAVGEHHHSPEEFLLYIEHYMHLARQTASTVWGPAAKPAVLDIIRKVAGLAVACMEQNGVVPRT